MVKKAANPESSANALTVAMQALQRSAQTETQIKQKLARRQYTEVVITQVLKKLRDLRLVDDAKYARDYISYRSRTNPLGSMYLKLKLIQKGVPKPIAEEAANTISPDIELGLARVAAIKRLNALGRFAPQQRKVKLARFLAGRGFSASTVYAVVQEM